MIFGDFDICDRMTSLQKLYPPTYNHFSKVSDSNRALSTVANVHTSVTSASTAILPTVENAHISVTSANSYVINALFTSFLPSIISLLSRFYLLLSRPTSFNQYSSRTNANKHLRIHHHLRLLVSRRLYKALLYFTLLYFINQIAI